MMWNLLSGVPYLSRDRSHVQLRAFSRRSSPCEAPHTTKAQGYRGGQQENRDCQNTNRSFPLQSEHGIHFFGAKRTNHWPGPFITISDSPGRACVGFRAFSMSCYQVRRRTLGKLTVIAPASTRTVLLRYQE